MEKPDYIKGLLTNDDKVLEAIYQNFAPRIQHHIVNTGGTIADAKDVFQDALMIIYQKAQLPDFTLTSQFYTFLYGICQFIWIRKKNKKANNTVTIDHLKGLIDEASIENDLINQEKHSIFKENLLKLNKDCQQSVKVKILKKLLGIKAQKSITDKGQNQGSFSIIQSVILINDHT